MALNKTFVKENGITTSYHKVTTVNFSQDYSPENQDGLLLGVEITSFLNQEYRENEQPIESDFYHFSITKEEEQEISAFKLAYKKIKELPQWTDAEDC